MRTRRQLFGDDLALEHVIHSECQFYVLGYCKRNLEAVRDTYSMKQNVSRVFFKYMRTYLVSGKATRL